MQQPFSKYQGTGNDFIVIDDRAERFDAAGHDHIRALCDRRFGIGADGLMLLRNADGYDFRMLYFNADGRPGSMCGNGGRCITLFASRLGLIGERAVFTAADGIHEADMLAIGEDGLSGFVSLKMADVGSLAADGDHLVIDTGSPHMVLAVDDPAMVDVVAEGRRIRNSPPYRSEGINVNFIARRDGALHMRTYERGVEDETLSCGTGAVAAALAAARLGWVTGGICRLHTPGGDLTVRFENKGSGFTGIRLEGPAAFVYEGMLP